MSWFSEIVGYPASARGILTTGGSLANFSAVVTARRERLPEDFLSGTIYASDQVHHSIQKAAMLAGFPEGNVPRDRLGRKFIKVAEASRAVAADRAAGKSLPRRRQRRQRQHGAVDDLAALRGSRRAGAPLVPVDGAYGGFFLLTERGRAAMAAPSADSITLDPHKSLFLPYGMGSSSSRRRRAETRHALSAVYLPSMQEDPDLVDFNQISPELSRSWRGLRVWLPIKMHGIAPFRKNLDEKLDLAAWATGQLRKIPGIEILAEPQLSIVAFRWARPGLEGEALNRANRELLDRINGKKRVYLTGTMLGDRFAIRICVLSFRTHADRMREGLDDADPRCGSGIEVGQ